MEVSRLEEELAESCAQRDELGIKYNVVSERVSKRSQSTRLLASII
jgi:hypothetical protein